MTLTTTELPLSAKRVLAAWNDFEQALISAEYSMVLTCVDEEAEQDSVLLVDFGFDRLYVVPTVPTEFQDEDNPPPLFRPQTHREW